MVQRVFNLKDPRLEKEFDDLGDALRRVGAAKETNLALARVLNRGAQRITKSAAGTIAKKTKLRVKAVQRRSRIKRATGADPSAVITLRLGGVPIVTSMNQRSLATKIGRGTNRRGVKFGGTQYAGAFVARVSESGQLQILRRKGKSRRPTEAIKIDVKSLLLLQTRRALRRETFTMQRDLLREYDFRLQRALNK